MTQPLILVGSARKNSDTQKLLDILFESKEHTLIDLLDYAVEQYNYEEKYTADDKFLQIIDAVLSHDTIVFATPVYWYAMSGYMKVFFDRLTDVVSSQKHIGRQLKGKRTFFIAVGEDEDLPEGFEVPFKRTSEYLDMEYISGFYCARKAFAHPETIIQNAAGFISLLG